jgi:D-alanyl-D-alanine carboxypeptidase
MENPIFYKTVSAKNVKVGDRYLVNHNKLLWRVEGADGVKTGYTRAAGRILVSSATRQGRRLIGVTINAPDDWNDHAGLMEDGFSRYQVKRLVSAGDVVATVEIAGGQSSCAQLIAAENFDYALSSAERVEIRLIGPGFVYAPVARGAEAGFAHLCVDGKDVGKLPLIYGETVEQTPEEEKGFLEKLFQRN